MASPAQSSLSKQEIIAKLKEGAATWNVWWSSVNSEARRKTDFSQIDLSRLDLKGALLLDVNFGDANLFQTDLRDTDLRGTDLSNVKGCLLSKQFAGADLTGAKLPEPIAKLYEKLGMVSEISDSAKKLFLALLGACLYSWLTIGITKDVDLITNRASSPLPIIQTAIPIVGFYVVAPLILLCIYFYFHFYLQKLWEELASLPAVFTDGRPLYARADPWLFNDLVRAHFSRLKVNRPFLSHVQQWISVLLAWWVVPITLFLFWGRYLARQDAKWTVVLSTILALSIVSAIQLYRLAKETLRGVERRPLGWKKALKARRTYTDIGRAAGTVTVLVLISLGAVSGVRVWDPTLPNAYHSPRTWIPWLTSAVGYPPFATLEHEDVSIKPADWIGKGDGELEKVKGANLIGRNLRYASASGAFLAKAQLQQSDLDGAELSSADFRESLLYQTHLAGATLIDAQVQNVKALEANFNNAELTKAQFAHAQLASATMLRATLVFADLSRADLTWAKLGGANLSGAMLTTTRLKQADLTDANLSYADLKGADLYSANLSRADLTEANLTGASLYAADLTQVKFHYAEIKYADLQAAKGLTGDIIRNECRGWQKAYFDDDMLKELGLPPDHNDKLKKEESAEQEWKNKGVAAGTLNK